MWNSTSTPVCPKGLLALFALGLLPAPPARADAPVPAVRVSISTEKADIRTVLSELFRKAGASFVLDSAVKGEVSVRVDGKPFNEALRAILDAVRGGPALDYEMAGGVYRVMPSRTSTEKKKEMPDAHVESESQGGPALEASGPPLEAPSPEWYVIPASPVAVGGGIRPRMYWQDDTALYVRVDWAPANPVWLPVGVSLPAAPVWTGAWTPIVQTQIGPRPPDAIGGGMVISGSVGLRATVSSHLAGAPGARLSPGGHFPR